MKPDRPEKDRQFRPFASCNDMSVIVESSVDILMRYRPAIEQLAANAVEQNVFYEPMLLLPALAQYGQDADTRFILIFRDTLLEGVSESVMCGFFPLRQRTHFRGLPCLHLSAIRYPHCYLSTPLLHRDHLLATLTALLEWLHHQDQYKLLDLPQITSEGEFIRTLEAVLEENGIASTTYSYVRTAFEPDVDVDSYLKRILSPSMHRSLRSKERRLAMFGTVEYAQLTRRTDLKNWIDDFLKLEASGWKGRYGTALALTASDRNFFRSIVSGAFEEQRLVMLSLNLASRPIAMLVNFDAGDGSYAFKVAFDEKYRRFSPGVLLDLELIRYLHRQPGTKWMDLCTDEGNMMFARLFDRTKQIRNLTISNGQILGDLAVHVLPILKRMKHTWHSVKLKSKKGF